MPRRSNRWPANSGQGPWVRGPFALCLRLTRSPMSLPLPNRFLRNPTRTARALAVVALLTVAVTWLWAHEGAHATLASDGVAVDVPHGAISLSADVRAAIG